MSIIKLDDIIADLTPDGWQVLSDTYNNLNTDMKFQCPEGHLVIAPWGKLRAKHYCPICASNAYKNMTTKVPQKKKGEHRFLALDQATHICGWSLYSGKQLLSYGIFEVPESDEEVERFNSVKEWLLNLIHTYSPDLIGIEGIQYQQQVGVTTFQTLARLQGVLMMACREEKVKFKICPTNTWRSHCNVTGRTRTDKKNSMRLLVKKWYDVTVTEDEADAVGIGKYLADTYVPKVEIIEWE